MARTEIKPGDELIRLPSGTRVLYRDRTHRYWVVDVDTLPAPGQKVTTVPLVGVSTIANIYAKDALPWWSMTVTCDGIADLMARGILRPSDEAPPTGPQIVDLLIEHRLTCNDVRDSAAERGTLAHDVLVRCLRDGKLPRLRDYPREWWPFIRAGASFILDHQPQVIDAETVVACPKLGVAGRYDLFARFPKLGGRTGRVDFKTSDKPLYEDDAADPKHAPYPEHLSQVEGYEVLANASGYEASDFRAVVRLDSEGRWHLYESPAGPEHFLGDLAAYRNRQSLKAAKPRKPETLAVPEGVAA